MFVLFDMVIHKPSHPETETNLALLDTLAGYFSRFDYATGGSIPCRLFSGFAHIANEFVRDQWQSTTTASEEPALQNTAQGTQGINFASRCTYSPGSYNVLSQPRETVMNATLTFRMVQLAHDTANDGDFFSRGYPPGNDTTLYSVLDENAAFDDQVFAGFDFSNLFEVNIPGFGRL